jgi:hypothetical protein
MPDQPFALSIISPQPPAEGEYEAIHATMTQSARGRWFLDEYARRNRSADTGLVLAAIARMESVIRSEMGQQPYQSFRNDLLDMATAITLTRAEVIRPEGQAQGEAAAPHAPSAQASPLLAAAERIADVAWAMRERGFDPKTCEQIEGLSSSILATPFVRDTDDRRTHQLSEVLGYLERRINVMLEAVSPAGRAEDATDPDPEMANGTHGSIGSDTDASQALPSPQALPSLDDEPSPSNDALELPAPERGAADATASEHESSIPAMAEEALASSDADNTPSEPELEIFAAEEPPVAAEIAARPIESAELLDATGDAAARADETEVPGPPAPEPFATLPTAEVEPADFLLEPMVLAVRSASPRQPPPDAGLELQSAESPGADSPPEAISEPDEQLFVPAQHGEPATVAPQQPVARPPVQPATRDPLAALRAMSSAERIALFT